MDRPLPPLDLDQLPVHPDPDLVQLPVLPPKDPDLPVDYIFKLYEAK